MARVDGVDYTEQGVEDIRQLLIEIRSDAMTEAIDRAPGDMGVWQRITGLTHAIVFLAEYRDVVESIEDTDGVIKWTPTSTDLNNEVLDDEDTPDMGVHRFDGGGFM